ncbi:MAG TPA: (d)CMP kinase [Vicinamibacterales bacterium]|nr:(d)CMP kinase [Vicinamibacterales bacterium]
MIIAIDGPSGAGKGTVARGVAARLGYRHIDTGAMYRAVAWKALAQGVDLNDETATAAVAAAAAIEVGDGLVRIDGRDVAQAIRTPEIDQASSIVAKQPRVREILIAAQRGLGLSGRVVMEGRDIGTVVFPHADLKVYLDASPAERARRRAHDPAHATGRAGTAVQDVATALDARDLSDRTRVASPLMKAPDAVKIDTTALSIDEVIEQVIALAKERS